MAAKLNTKKIMSLHTPDLTQSPPRSPRVRLGGYCQLPRMLDKARAELTGQNGEYHYNCPLDQQFFGFTGIAADALKAVATKSDTEVLAWVNAHAKRTAPEIIAWSRWMDERAPDNVDGREFFNGVHKSIAPLREDIATWFDLLDLDDFVSYGGKA